MRSPDPKLSHVDKEENEPRLTTPLTAAQRFASAVWGPLLGLIVNLILVVIKFFAGIASGSVALVADAGHSGADVFNNILVLASLFYSRRGSDEDHPYGHDRAEVLSAMGSAFILLAAGLYFAWDSIQKLIEGIPEPTLLALWVAIGTLVVKVGVAWVEWRIGSRVHSPAIQADARDNMADVLSSLAVVGGVIGAHLGQPRLDGLGGLIIAALILWNAWSIGWRASAELLDRNLDNTVLEQVRQQASRVQGVRINAVTGRRHGSDVLVELSIAVDPHLSIERGVELAEEVRQQVYSHVPNIGDVVVELNTDHIARLRRQLR